MSVQNNAIPIDYSSLTLPLTYPQRWKYIKQHYMKLWLKLFLAETAVVVFVNVLSLLFNATSFLLVTDTIMLPVLLVFVTLLVYSAAYGMSRSGVRGELFATANGFTFTANRPLGERVGLFLWKQASRYYEALVTAGTYAGRNFSFGTRGLSRANFTGPYMSITLPKALPHIRIDARQGVLNFSTSPETLHQIRLPEAFTKYFTVYLPADCPSEELSFLTPELLQTMIDQDFLCDMEVIGDQLYFYRPYGRARGTKLVLLTAYLSYEQSILQTLFQLLESVGDGITPRLPLHESDRTMVPAQTMKRLRKGRLAAFIFFFVVTIALMVLLALIVSVLQNFIHPWWRN